MKKNINLEFIRVLSCLFVLLNHTVNQAFFASELSQSWLLSAAIMVLVKPAVPLFLMISGSLLLQKRYTWKEIFKKELIFFSIFFLFSIFYYVVDPTLKGTDESFWYLFFAGKITNSFWYLYMYLALILMVPFIKKMTDAFQRVDYYLFLGVLFVCASVLPYLVGIWEIPISTHFLTTIFSPYLSYFVFGHYYLNVRPKRTSLLTKWAFPTYLFFSILSFLLFYFFKKYDLNYMLWDNYAISFNWWLISVSLFVILNRISFVRFRYKSVIYLFAKHTFGIYLLSDLYIHMLRNRMYQMKVDVNQFGNMFFLGLFIFMLGFVTMRAGDQLFQWGKRKLGEFLS